MKSTWRSIILALSSLAIANPAAFAQTEARPSVADTRVLGWQDVLSLARTQNMDIQDRNSVIRAREMSARAAYSGFLPSLSVYANRANSELETLGINSRDKGDEFGARVTYSLFSGFATVGSVRKGEAQVRRAESDKAVTAVDVRYRLRIAYFGMLIAQDRLQLAKKVAERDRVNLQLLKLKYEAGAEALWSVQQAESEVASSELTVKDEEKEFLRSEADVRHLLNLPDSERLAVTEDSSALQPVAASDAARLASAHPNVSLLRASVDSAREDIRIADSGFFPQVSMQYEKGKKTPDGSSSPINSTRWGLSITLSLFEGLNTYHTSRSARYERESLEIRLANSQNEVRTQIEIAERDLQVRLARIPISRQVLAAARARAKTVNEQYKVGLKSFLEWEQAESRLTEAEKQEIMAKRDAYMARAEWERARGEVLQ